MENVRLRFENAEASLSVRGFRIEERLSRPFRVEVQATSPRASLELGAFVGHRAELSLGASVDVPVLGLHARCFRGVCERMDLVRVSDDALGLATYSITIVATLWRLSQRTNRRHFQHVSIPRIVDEVLGEWGITRRFQIDAAAYPALELRTQYDETDLAFVSRLLEEAGITTWFEDDGEADATLVLGDAPQANAPRPGAIPFRDATFQALAGGHEHVTALTVSERSRPGRVTLIDYDFRRPRSQSLVTDRSEREEERAHEQLLFTPGAYVREIEASPATATPTADDLGTARAAPDFGARLARRMVEALDTSRRTLTFQTNVSDLLPGTVLHIDDHPSDSVNGVALLVTSFTLEGQVAVADSWRFTAEAVPAAQPYRPPFVTPKPRIHGLQTAVVVGPSAGAALGAVGAGEPDAAAGVVAKLAATGAGASALEQAAGKLVDNTIYVDEHGRVRAQFPWDREGEFDGRSSMWMRVSQGGAGGGYGLFTIPRVGHEVLVSFIDGDPDCPLIVGRVHNVVEPAPFKLPENKTVSTFRTATSPGGVGFNELRFDDAAGREHLFVQAQRDSDHLVKNDHKEAVGRDRSRYVQNDESVGIGHDRTQIVNHNQIDATGLNHVELIGLSRATSIGVEDSTHVGARWSVTVARGLTARLAHQIEDVAVSVGSVMRSAATSVFGAIPSDPRAAVAEAALSSFGRAAAERLRGALSRLDTLGASPGPPPTSIEMVDRKITLTTGEASIVLDGPNVSITADGAITFHAKRSVSVLAEEELALAGRAKVALVSATDDVIVQARKSLHLNPYVGSGAPPEPAARLDGDVNDARCPRCGGEMNESAGGPVCPQHPPPESEETA